MSCPLYWLGFTQWWTPHSPQLIENSLPVFPSWECSDSCGTQEVQSLGPGSGCQEVSVNIPSLRLQMSWGHRLKWSSRTSTACWHLGAPSVPPLYLDALHVHLAAAKLAVEELLPVIQVAGIMLQDLWVVWILQYRLIDNSIYLLAHCCERQ